MKKILTCTIIIILSCLTFAITFAQEQDGDKKYYPTANNYIYDLKTFNYDPKNNEFSIDIFYDFDYASSEFVPSPFDKNDIRYLIFSTKYHPETNKLDIKYKGFVSANLVITKLEGNKRRAWYNEVKIYYDDNVKYIPELKQYIKEFLEWLDYIDKNDNYKQEVTKEIFEAYKKGELYKLEHARSMLFNPIEYTKKYY